MQKRLLILGLILTFGLFLSSCGKEDPITPPPAAQPAKLKVMIKEALQDGSVIPQANAKIQLYKTEADWMAKTNAAADVTADGNGEYTFENLEAINYMFHAQSQDGTRTNAKTGNQTGVLKSGETKTLQVTLKP